MTVTIPAPTVDTEALDRLGANLAEYIERRTKFTDSELIDKKGNDARIQCWRFYNEEKYGGSGGRRGDGIAWRDLRARARGGRGTYVRSQTLDPRWGTPPNSKSGKPLTQWQALVWQETTRRQKGIGVLGAAFLSKRFRYARGERYLVANNSKTLGSLVEIRKEGGGLNRASYTIEMFTPGGAKVAQRYDILNRVVNYLNIDIEKYLNGLHLADVKAAREKAQKAPVDGATVNKYKNLIRKMTRQ